MIEVTLEETLIAGFPALACIENIFAGSVQLW
jgi:hypothetical protein